jgi:hypothetical protein
MLRMKTAVVDALGSTSKDSIRRLLNMHTPYPEVILDVRGGYSEGPSLLYFISAWLSI